MHVGVTNQHTDQRWCTRLLEGHEFDAYFRTDRHESNDGHHRKRTFRVCKHGSDKLNGGRHAEQLYGRGERQLRDGGDLGDDRLAMADCLGTTLAKYLNTEGSTEDVHAIVFMLYHAWQTPPEMSCRREARLS